jgi:hypothetical protein
MSSVDVAEVVSASSLGAVCWVDDGGRPRARGVVALTHGARPALAFTYADELVAREIAAASRVVLALHETRSTGRSFAPVALTGRPNLVEDPAGDLYLSELVVQELRRYPPSRVFADSPLLMREHWWYLPRLVVELDVDTAAGMEPRSELLDHLLVTAAGPAPLVRTAGIVTSEPGRLDVTVQGDATVPGDAVLFGQDATFPDLEQWVQWSYVGRWDGAVLRVDEAPAATGLGRRPPGLLARWRRQRDLRRRCVAAIPGK